MHNRSYTPEKRIAPIAATQFQTHRKYAERACIFSKVKMHTFGQSHSYGIVSHKYFITLFSQVQYKIAYYLRYPPLSANAATMEVAEFLCSYRRGFVPLLKSRFFVIYFRGVTLAKYLTKGGEPDERPTWKRWSVLHRTNDFLLSQKFIVEICRKLWYNQPKPKSVRDLYE